jgi:hypothetical protein
MQVMQDRLNGHSLLGGPSEEGHEGILITSVAVARNLANPKG